MTAGEIVTTVVDPERLEINNAAERNLLFFTEWSDTAIDIYFIKKIEDIDGTIPGPAGETLAPSPSGPIEAGIMIADESEDGLLAGQEVVRTVAHEIGHYFLNNANGDIDHFADDALLLQNLMFRATNQNKRDLTEAQCLEMRNDAEID